MYSIKTGPNGKKCQFFQTKLAYLGHIVSDQAVSVDLVKVEKVRLWQTSGELASFLELASYYRRFIPGCTPPHYILQNEIKREHQCNFGGPLKLKKISLVPKRILPELSIQLLLTLDTN